MARDLKCNVTYVTLRNHGLSENVELGFWMRIIPPVIRDLSVQGRSTAKRLSGVLEEEVRA